tara:strand:- start:4718 stop:4906 length:189 start_codon:yes stop_codon:yes gene_type:complete
MSENLSIKVKDCFMFKNKVSTVGLKNCKNTFEMVLLRRRVDRKMKRDNSGRFKYIGRFKRNG